MKTTKSLLALPVLAALGISAANAATVATYDAVVTPLDLMYHLPSNTDTISGEVTPGYDLDILAHDLSYGMSGSAVLDDSGTLTITATFRSATIIGTDTNFGEVVTIYGSWDGSAFTATSGSMHFLSCSDNITTSGLTTCSPFSSSFSLNVEYSLASVAGSANLSSGSFTTMRSRPTFDEHFQYVLSNGTPAVPIPAAAWLLGSSLLGLLGIKRQRLVAG